METKIALGFILVAIVGMALIYPAVASAGELFVISNKDAPASF